MFVLVGCVYRRTCLGWSATVFEGGGTISQAESAKKISDPPPFAYLGPGDTKTEHCTVFIIVIMTSKRLPAANEIT